MAALISIILNVSGNLPLNKNMHLNFNMHFDALKLYFSLEPARHPSNSRLDIRVGIDKFLLIKIDNNRY
jgi:hypothetical protein